MHDERRELYREFTGWAAWVHVVVWGAIGASALVTPWPWWAVLLLLGGAIHVALGGLLVTVHSDGVRVGLGRLRLLGTFIPLSDITRVEPVTYQPLKEFGGWGFRGSREKRAWTARGNRALLLDTQDGRQIYIGSDDPRTLETRIRSAISVGGYSLDAGDRP